jgi:hypothetical protein
MLRNVLCVGLLYKYLADSDVSQAAQELPHTHQCLCIMIMPLAIY